MNKGKAPLFMVTWRCTRRCEGNCLYCSFNPEFNPKEGIEPEVNTKEAFRIVDQIYEFGSPWFGISGGEPLVREDIFEVIAYAKKIGFEVSLITSGLTFDEKRYNGLVKNEVHTAVSVDGPKEANDKIRGPGSYDKAVYAMKKLSEANILDCIVVTMTKYNFKYLEHIIELAAQYKARMAVFHNLVPVGRAQVNINELAPSPEEYEWAFNQLYDLSKKYEGKVHVNVYAPFYARIVRQRNPADFWDWFMNKYLGKCTMGGNYISVTENGDFRSCGFNEGYRLGNVKNKTLTQCWEELQHSELHLKIRDKNNLKGKCGVCEYREICGGCRTRAEFYTGDLFASDPACAYVPRILREEVSRR
ncbi:MAG: radical SAM protein [Nitrososphaerota archaeon]|nr:radical SAM protein [Candidatus Bathyarchaeota archaeon]MDW8194453.1 radical SAM protein [Nitrososphaerota archaeon]